MSKALYKAIKAGDEEGLLEALNEGADVNSTDKKGKVSAD
jgi:hypothetical protein